MRWECLVAVVEIRARSLSSHPGCRCSCHGSSLVGRCTVSSWHSDRFVFPLLTRSGFILTVLRPADVERDQLPNRATLWVEWTDGYSTLHHWCSILRCLCCLVSALSPQARHLGPFPPLVLLQRCLPPYRTSLYQQGTTPRTRYPFLGCDLGIRCSICRRFRLLRSQLR